MPTVNYYAENIRESTTAHIRTGQGDTTAADIRAVFGTVAEAVEFFEGLSRGAQILHGEGAPDNSLGLDIDAYVDTLNTDLYLKESGEWLFKLTLRGKDGTNGKNGTNGSDGKNGAAGKSTYQLWLDAGNQGTLAQFLAAQKGKDGKDGSNGVPGSRIHWESFAPTTEAGSLGDTWFHSISATKVAIYDCMGAQILQQSETEQQGTGSSWRLRFTSPDGSSSSGNTAPAGVSSFAGRTGAVSLLASDVYALFAAAGTNTALVIDGNGKIRINATGGDGNTPVSPLPAESAATNGYFLKSAGAAGSAAWAPLPASGHIIKDAAGATVTQPVMIFRNGLRIVENTADGTMAIELDPAGVPASEANQAGTLLNFSAEFQIRLSSTGNITLNDFQSVASGREIRLELNPSTATDQLLIGGVTINGEQSNFQATVKISPTAASGSNQNCTFYDVGGPFIGGVKNVFKIKCIGTNRFEFRIFPLV